VINASSHLTYNNPNDPDPAGLPGLPGGVHKRIQQLQAVKRRLTDHSPFASMFDRLKAINNQILNKL